jgi:hypothetical protein
MALLAVRCRSTSCPWHLAPRVNDLIEAIHYQSTSPAAGSKTINYALTDAELETVNQSLALTITGTQAPTISGLNTTLSINTVRLARAPSWTACWLRTRTGRSLAVAALW